MNKENSLDVAKQLGRGAHQIGALAWKRVARAYQPCPLKERFPLSSLSLVFSSPTREENDEEAIGLLCSGCTFFAPKKRKMILMESKASMWEENNQENLAGQLLYATRSLHFGSKKMELSFTLEILFIAHFGAHK